MSKKLITAEEYFTSNPLFELEELLDGKMSASYMSKNNEYKIKCLNCDYIFDRKGDSKSFAKVSKCPNCLHQYDVETKKILKELAKKSPRDMVKIVKQTKASVLVTDDEEEEEQEQLPVNTKKSISPFDIILQSNNAVAIKPSSKKVKKVLTDNIDEEELEPIVIPKTKKVPEPTTTTTGVPRDNALEDLIEKLRESQPQAIETMVKVVRLKSGEVYMCGDVFIVAE